MTMSSDARTALARRIYETAHITGEFTLRSGAKSNEYFDKYLFEAFSLRSEWPDGIYEAIGPKIQGNPEKSGHHMLVSVVPCAVHLHINNAPRTFDGLRDYFQNHDLEGIVFHHPDGRLAKIKGKDFGIKRPALPPER